MNRHLNGRTLAILTAICLGMLILFLVSIIGDQLLNVPILGALAALLVLAIGVGTFCTIGMGRKCTPEACSPAPSTQGKAIRNTSRRRLGVAIGAIFIQAALLNFMIAYGAMNESVGSTFYGQMALLMCIIGMMTAGIATWPSQRK